MNRQAVAIQDQFQSLMIQRNTHDWYILLSKLHQSKSKSNRDILCGQCWEMLNYESCRMHKLLQPTHQQMLITSRNYSKEEKFIQVARRFNRTYIDQITGQECFENPYKPKNNKQDIKMKYHRHFRRSTASPQFSRLQKSSNFQEYQSVNTDESIINREILSLELGSHPQSDQHYQNLDCQQFTFSNKEQLFINHLDQKNNSETSVNRKYFDFINFDQDTLDKINLQQQISVLSQQIRDQLKQRNNCELSEQGKIKQFISKYAKYSTFAQNPQF